MFAAQVFDSKQFMRHTPTEWSSESSDLGMKPGQLFGAIFNDACDQGLLVRSRKTGKLAVFTLVKEDTREDEVTAWRFEATRPHQSMFRFGELAKFDDYKDIKIVVFND